jgi:hypothetical protein
MAHTEGHRSGVDPLGEIQQDVDRIAALVRNDLRQGLAFKGRLWTELGNEDAIRSASGALQRCGVAVAEALAGERVAQPLDQRIAFSVQCPPRTQRAVDVRPSRGAGIDIKRYVESISPRTLVYIEHRLSLAQLALPMASRWEICVRRPDSRVMRTASFRATSTPIVLLPSSRMFGAIAEPAVYAGNRVPNSTRSGPNSRHIS